MYKQLLIGILLIMLNSACDTAPQNEGAHEDRAPENFSFIDERDVALSTLVTSNSIIITGINSATNISVEGGEYSINNAAFTSHTGDVNEGDTVTLRQTSSELYLTTTNTRLTVGSVSDTFSVTTVDAESPIDLTPDAFNFIDQYHVATGAIVTSNAIVVSGINAAASIAISNGEYSVNGGPYTTGDSEVNEGDVVAIQLTASSNYNTTTNATLSISGVSDTFSITTAAATAVPVDFVLPPLSAGNPSFTSEHFSGSQNCSLCHEGLTDNTGKDVSIVTDWSSSIMANATRDPFWRAKLSSELKRNPALSEVINDKCSRCHAPMANEEMRRNNEFVDVLGSGLLDANHERHDEAMEGVSCTLCHQVTDTAKLGSLEGFSGKYEINNSKMIYGQYSNIFAQPMLNNTGFTPVYSAHIQQSELCASCHNLKTPYVDEFGNILSHNAEDEFPEQMPYTEWLHSDYVSQKSCQDCHMSRSDGVVMAIRPPRLSTQRNNFAVHDFIGANSMMLEILDTNRDQLGVRSSNFAETIAKTDAMLSSAASIQLRQSTLLNGKLDFTLRVNSNTGHKLPSSFPSRRVILQVTVRDSSGQIVFQSGRVNGDGSVEGVDADANGQSYEPHHDVITAADQVQVYEAIMGNNHDQVTYTLLRGKHYLKDNRLLPTGFNKNTVPADVAVKGGALSDTNFVGGSDEVRYLIDGLIDSSYSVEAAMVYQTLAYAYAQDLFQDRTPEVNDFQIMYNNSNRKASVIATTRFSIN